jgi:DNA oxidative demethylase
LTTGRLAPIADLFAGAAPSEDRERLAEGAVLLRGLALAQAPALAAAVEDVAAISPFRHMTTPGGFRMSVAMTSCGEAGWVSDRNGYRYAAMDPATGGPWPAMPVIFRSLAARAAASAGFAGFIPDACLINRYEPETRLSLHRDEDERDLSAPVVSVSLGLPAVFLWGGLTRKERARRLRLESGDVVVWGGPARLVYHGIAPLGDGEHPLTGCSRINLTFRKAL